MPTASRLTGALLFAAAGFGIYMFSVDGFQDGQVPGFYLPLCIIAGLWAGWYVCGKSARGFRSGIGQGLTAIIGQAFVIVFVSGCVIMFKRAMRGRLEGPMEAVIDVFSETYALAVDMATPQLGLVIIACGAVAGAITGIIGKRFPN